MRVNARRLAWENIEKGTGELKFGNDTKIRPWCNSSTLVWQHKIGIGHARSLCADECKCLPVARTIGEEKSKIRTFSCDGAAGKGG